jgi:hypothetical protein
LGGDQIVERGEADRDAALFGFIRVKHPYLSQASREIS